VGTLADNEAWTLERLFRAAASFPAHVTECPKRTWAILTKYDTNRAFLAWAATHGVRVLHFGHVQDYASDLLNAYVQFKYQLARLQLVLADPAAYARSAAADAVEPAAAPLVTHKRAVRAEMCKIAAELDKL
jgi:hypothetical protein